MADISGDYSCPVLVCPHAILLLGFLPSQPLLPKGRAASDKPHVHCLPRGELCRGQQPASLHKGFSSKKLALWGWGLSASGLQPWGCVKWESVANRVLLGLHCSLSGLSRWTQTAQSLFRQSDLSCRGILIVRARRFPLISGVSRYLNGFVVQDFGCWPWSLPCREHTWAAATDCWSRCLGPS